MRISSLEQQKRRKDRVSVFLDGEFWIGVSERLCLELGLCAGEEIDATRKAAIEAAAVEDGALQYAFDRLSSGLIPTLRLRKKLLEKGYGEKIVGDTIERCGELGLLDDDLWAETVAEERARRGQGRRRVEMLLREQGIDSDRSDALLDRIFAPEKERSEAKAVLEKSYQTPLAPPDQRRGYSMLLRRGFSASASADAVALLSMNPEEAEEAWGHEEALEALQRRFSSDVSKEKAWNYLRRRSFSPEAIRRALENFYS